MLDRAAGGEMFRCCSFARPPRRLALGFALAVTILLAGAGCGDKTTAPQDYLPSGDAVPDFHLTDLNPNSTTHGRAVSPRDEVGKVSAWYFGHST
jgi:hypothetical protein